MSFLKNTIFLPFIASLFAMNYAQAQSCDTLRNYNPNDDFWQLTAGTSSFILGQDSELSDGTNFYEANNWSESYTVGAATQVRAIRFAPWKVDDLGTVDSIAFYVWGDNAGSPDLTNELGKQWIRYDEMTANQFNFLEFTTPANVNGTFHVGYELNYDATQDTFALLGTQPASNFTRFQAQNPGAPLDGMWFDVSDVYSNGGTPINTAFVLDVLTSTGTAPTADFDILPASSAICLGSDFNVDGAATTGDVDIYSWILGDNPFTTDYDQATGQNATLTPTSSTPSTQAIYLIADGACVFDIAAYLVDVYPAVNATVSVSDPTCGLNNGGIDITGSIGGDGTYSYSIDGGTNFQTQTSYTGLAPGSYDIVVSTNGGGCEYLETVTLTNIPAETVTAGADEAICEGDAVTITASGSGSIEWFDGGGNSVGTGASISVSPTTTTTYDAVLTDGNGCTDTDQLTVTVNPVNDATFSYSSATLCLGGANETPTINGTGTFTATPAGLVFADASTGEIDMTSSTANTYNITFTTTGTCGETFMETITLTSSPDATFSYSAAEFCAEVGTEAPSFPSGSSAGTFSTTPAGLSINASNGTITLDASTANTYTVTNTIAASGSCPQVVATEDITINALPTVDAGADQEVCDGDQVTLTATGADTYTWDNGASQGVAFTPSVGVTTFTVTGEITATGCQNTDEVDVTVNENPTVDAGVDQEVCDGEEVTLTATTSVGTVSWDSGVTDGTPFTPTATATYTVTADNNGCTSTDQVTVTVNDLPLVDAGADQTACANHDPITLSGTPAGGTYSGTSVSGNEFDPSVGAGTYTVTYTYTDGNGCEASNDLTVTVDGCASIDENDINESITIMPNPATDYIDVVMEGTNTINSIQLLSAEGRVVELNTSTLDANTTRIDVSAAAKGTYFIQLNTLNGQITKKVILQ